MPVIAMSLLALYAATGAWLDVVSRRLPNWLCLLTGLTGLAVAFAAGGAGSLWSPLAHAGITLVIGMALFRFGLIGGGDAKFYAACAAWFPLASAPALLFAVSLAGLGVIALWFAYRRIRRVRVRKEDGPFGMVPYGLAMAIGAVALKAWTP